MLMLTYFFAVFSDPGYVQNENLELSNNEDFIKIKQETENVKERIKTFKKRLRENKKQNPDFENFSSSTNEEIETEINNLYFQQLEKRTYCFKCLFVKEARTHHCRTCNKCVRRMDHHCPWTGNCVGEENIAFFIQFLFYASSTILIAIFTEFFLLVFGFFSFKDEVIRIFMGFHLFMGFLVGLSIFYLFFYQVQNVMVNLTTVEDYIKGASVRKPFDKGWKLNLEDIFGKNYKIINIILPIRAQRLKFDSSF